MSHSSPRLKEVRFIAAPNEGEFLGLAWLPSTREFVVNYRSSKSTKDSWDLQLYSMREDGSDFNPLPLSPDPDCKYTSRHLPRTLPDGRLAYVQRCWVSLTPERHLPTEAVTLWAYDPVARSSEQLVPYFLPYRPSAFDFAPNMQVGLLNEGNRLYHNLYWIRANQLEYLELALEKPGSPSWSPDGRTIAIDGVPYDLEKDSIDRLELPAKLYLLSTDDLSLEPVADGFINAAVSAWSPDGRWLAVQVGFSLQDEDDQALWLIEPSTGHRHTLISGSQYGTGPAIWVDDRTLAKLAWFWSRTRPAGDEGSNGLYIFELPNLDQYATEPKPVK